MYTILTFASIAAFITFRATTAFAQSDNSTDKTCSTNSDPCSVKLVCTPNATGSYDGPGFSLLPSNASTDVDWTYNTSIHVDKDHQIWRYFSVDTPSFKSVEDVDNTFQLYDIAFDDLPRSTYINGQEDSGDCRHTLNRACSRAL
ncbi:MAG: hypothetical protein L6R41_005428, partial [Letrouitia leprolyta]